MGRGLTNRSYKYGYIVTTNDAGRRVLKGPYIPGQSPSIEEDRDRLDRPSNVIFLPTRNINAASSMLRNNISNEDGVDEASTTKISHHLSNDRGGI